MSLPFDSAAALEACAQAVGPAPRELAGDGWGVHGGMGPAGRDVVDLLQSNVEGLPRLGSQGAVCWGALVMANRTLFDSGAEPAPASVAFSLSPATKVDVAALVHTARCCEALRHEPRPTQPELLPVWAHLRDEMSRRFGLPVPATLAGETPTLISSTMVFPRTLPDGVLRKRLFPVLVLPDAPHQLSVLPAAFWPDELRAWWSSVDERFDTGADDV